jgi:chaperone modulatory protein CbpM
MINEHEVLSKITSISAGQLRVWILEEWVRPARSGNDVVFNEADLARVRLLDTLKNQLEIDHEAIPIILSLLDQVLDLREQMRIVSSVIESQPEDVRIEILRQAAEKL